MAVTESRQAEGEKDVDNLVKLVLDALNGVVWDDDSQILALSASKQLSVTACTRVTVYLAESGGRPVG